MVTWYQRALRAIGTRLIVLSSSICATVIRILHSQREIEKMYCDVYRQMGGTVVVIQDPPGSLHARFKLVNATSVLALPRSLADNLSPSSALRVILRGGSLSWAISKHHVAYYLVLETLRCWVQRWRNQNDPYFEQRNDRAAALSPPRGNASSVTPTGPRFDYAHDLDFPLPQTSSTNLEILQWCTQSPGEWMRSERPGALLPTPRRASCEEAANVRA